MPSPSYKGILARSGEVVLAEETCWQCFQAAGRTAAASLTQCANVVTAINGCQQCLWLDVCLVLMNSVTVDQY